MLSRLIIILMGSVSLTGCVIVADVDADWDWRGHWVQQDQSLGEIATVDFSARGTLYITQGKSNELVLEGHKDALSKLDVEERNGTVYIKAGSTSTQWYKHSRNGKEPVYRLTIQNIEQLNHRGHGTVRMGPLTAENLQVESKGHANTHLASVNAKDVELTALGHARIKVETLDADAIRLQVVDHADIYVEDSNLLDARLRAEDHGELWLAGKADSMEVTASDHSDVDAEAFAVSVATVRARDFAKLKVNVDEDANIDQSDRAQVDIVGEAPVEQ